MYIYIYIYMYIYIWGCLKIGYPETIQDPTLHDDHG